MDESLGLQLVSIRLPKELIELYQTVAEVYGITHLHLMCEALRRSTETELKAMDLFDPERQLELVVETKQL